MAKGIFIISICAALLGTELVSAQNWFFLEQDKGLCAVDSLVVNNPVYNSLIDTIEYYWSKCEFDKNQSVVWINFLDTNHLTGTVMQIIEISPLVTSCYMNKIYGVICSRGHQYYFGATYEWMIDKKALQKSSSVYSPPYFSVKKYRELTTKNDFLFRKTTQRKRTYPFNPFDEEWNEEVYDKLRFEIFLSEDGIIYKELEGCMHSNSNSDPNPILK